MNYTSFFFSRMKIEKDYAYIFMGKSISATEY